MTKVSTVRFLKDVLLAALASYGGPEAHYGVFQSQLVEDKNYLTDEELAELIGLYSLVAGPGSTQTITAIGYHVGGPVLAILTFLVWAFPAILVMALFGVFFTQIDGNQSWEPILTYLPAVAVGFIVYAAINMTRKNLHATRDWALYLLMLMLSFLFANRSIWSVPLLLVFGGLVVLVLNFGANKPGKFQVQFNWSLLLILIGLAVISELVNWRFESGLINIFTSFYRYGYSAMGGGQIVIPLMIQDLVEGQSIILREDFLAGYAIDQAVPGPLFSFAVFVSARALAGTGYAFLGGVLGGLAIFAPGILLVYIMFPLWRSLREHIYMKKFLRGVTITVAALITMTAVTQILALPENIVEYILVGTSTLLLLTKKIPAPLIVLGAALLGFLV